MNRSRKICNSTGLFHITATKLQSSGIQIFNILQRLKLLLLYWKEKGGWKRLKIGTQIFQAFFNTDNRFVFLCLQVLKISPLLFRVAPSPLYKIKCFSFRQIRHFLVDGLYCVPLLLIFHPTSWSMPLSLRCERQGWNLFCFSYCSCPSCVRELSLYA